MRLPRKKRTRRSRIADALLDLRTARWLTVRLWRPAMSVAAESVRTTRKRVRR